MPATAARFVAHVYRELRRVGLEPLGTLSARGDPRPSGDAIVVVKVGRFRLRITRERTQEWVDLAPDNQSAPFYQFGDVEDALGWRMSEDPERPIPPLGAMLRRLSDHWNELEEAFTPAMIGRTTEDLQAAIRRRQEWMSRHFDSVRPKREAK